jgi:MFS family permease
MTCETKQRIGFLGACFFIGVLTASTIIPVGFLSDVYGRKIIFLITLFILLGACVGMMLARTLDELYVYMFLMGITFPGRLIVATNYAQEFLPAKMHGYI